MCGLTAFTGHADIAVLQALVDEARRRGPDSLGMAWCWNGGWEIRRLRTASWPERVTLIRPTQTTAGIGHARLATSGAGIRDAQPLMIEDMVFAHNGTVYRHEEMARAYGLPQCTGNDSEVFGRLFRLFGYDAEAALEEIRDHQGETPHAFIAAAGSRMWLGSFGQPLYIRETPEARYACSWRFPGGIEVPKGEVLRWEL